MALPVEYDEPWNEDDRLFADGMEAILTQAYNAEGLDGDDYVLQALLARIAVELHAIRDMLDHRLPWPEEEPQPWEDV